jgi:hypothetical protein
MIVNYIDDDGLSVLTQCAGLNVRSGAVPLIGFLGPGRCDISSWHLFVAVCFSNHAEN